VRGKKRSSRTMTDECVMSQGTHGTARQEDLQGMFQR
jgi:hypothetical protein